MVAIPRRLVHVRGDSSCPDRSDEPERNSLHGSGSTGERFGSEQRDFGRSARIPLSPLAGSKPATSRWRPTLASRMFWQDSAGRARLGGRPGRTRARPGRSDVVSWRYRPSPTQGRTAWPWPPRERLSPSSWCGDQVVIGGGFFWSAVRDCPGCGGSLWGGLDSMGRGSAAPRLLVSGVVVEPPQVAGWGRGPAVHRRPTAVVG